jgi:D-glycero-D-manno-heptose 1,7-bisphosphate phosphatase
MKAVFLDRDGVINELVYYAEHGIVDGPFTPAQMKVLPGVPKALEDLKKLGYKLVIISNQPGIAKGFFDENTFAQITQALHAQMNGSGKIIDGEYYCLHHPQAKIDKYRQDCQCRKPRPGLIIQAAAELDLDLKSSWMLGDGVTDIQAGCAAGCRTILIGKMKCETCAMMAELGIKPDFTATGLPEAVDIIRQWNSV